MWVSAQKSGAGPRACGWGKGECGTDGSIPVEWGCALPLRFGGESPMFALSSAIGRRLTAGPGSELVVHWRRGADAYRPQMADLRAAGADRMVLDLGEGALDAEVVALAAEARRAGMVAEVVAAPAAGWTAEMVSELREAGLARATVRLALDAGPSHPRRPVWEPSEGAARAVDAALQAGVATGVGVRLTRNSTSRLAALLEWVERSGLHGCDVAHVMPEGRLDWRAQLTLPGQTRFALRTLATAAWDWHQRRLPARIRTWHGPADPIFVYIWCLRHAPEQAPAALAAARAKAAGWPDVAWIDPLGNVAAVAGVPALTLGTVGRRPFSDIWLDRGRAGWQRTRALYDDVGAPCAACRWSSLCHGGERARAMTDLSLGGPDPGCCLTERETAAAG